MEKIIRIPKPFSQIVIWGGICQELMQWIHSEMKIIFRLLVIPESRIGRKKTLGVARYVD